MRTQIFIILYQNKKYITYRHVLEYLTYSINDSIGCIRDFCKWNGEFKRDIYSQSPFSVDELWNTLCLAKKSVWSNTASSGILLISAVRI